MTTKAVETTEVTELGQAELYLASALVKNESTLEHLAELIKQQGGEVKKTESLGQKQLAYPINKQPALTLISVFFTAPKNVIAPLEKELKQDEMIERSLVTTWRGDLDAPERNRNRERRESSCSA
jgi:ribosomal protein S6